MAKQIGNSKPTHEEIAQRARAIYEQSGRVPGRDLENWLEAEAQLSGTRKNAAEEKPETKPQVQNAGRSPMGSERSTR